MGHDVIPMSRIYVHNFTEFMVRLNGSTTAIGEVAVLDIVADLYRTSIQHVESVVELVGHVTEMISEEDKFNAMKRIILQRREGVDFFFNSSLLEIIVGKQKELIDSLRNISERTGNMSEIKERSPFINAITSGKISRFLDAQYWAQQLEEETQVLVDYQTELSKVQYWQFIMHRVAPVLNAIVMVVGMTSNGLLLTIFVRHKETRTLANSMLINLTVVDMISLLLNELLHYVVSTTTWQLCCKAHNYFCSALVAVSTYSVLMMSVQRFVAVTQLPSLGSYHQSQKTKYVLIATVWGIGCILSMPHAVSNECNDLPHEVSGLLYTSDFITLCVVPLLITSAFTGLTAYRIRRSAREIPGEATGQQQLQHRLMVSSTVLFALTVVFVVSYTPYFLFRFLIFEVCISVPFWEYFLVHTITYHLRFVNCCLNPIVLFVMNKRFRAYIKRYCGQREVQPATNSGSSTETPL